MTPPDAQLDALLRDALPTTAPAIVLCVLRDGHTVYHRAWGDADLTTYFDLASVTKTFTATAFLALVAAGKVTLDSPVVAVIPEFGANNPRAMGNGHDPHTRQPLPTPPDKIGQTVNPAQVTFRQLLAHTSGLPAWTPLFQLTQPPPAPPAGLPNQRQTLQTVYDSPFRDRPGISFCYSDLGFMLLGEAVARLHGTPLDEAIRERVTAPLNLQTVTYNPLAHGIRREQIAPTEYDADWRSERVQGDVHDENAYTLGGVSGHAGLFGTTADIAQYGRAWLQPEQHTWAITEVIRQQAWAPHSNTYALGFVRFDDGSVGHTGFTGTLLRMDAERGLVAALMTNRVYHGRDYTAIGKLYQDVWNTVTREATA
jgi:serine-type D-Ala-D-Ala carboxypeptidase